MKNHFKYLGKHGICWCYQQALMQIRRTPLAPLPFPFNRRTSEPQQPNGAVITVS